MVRAATEQVAGASCGAGVVLELLQPGLYGIIENDLQRFHVCGLYLSPAFELADQGDLHFGFALGVLPCARSIQRAKQVGLFVTVGLGRGNLN